MFKIIEFQSQNARLKGRLYTPDSCYNSCPTIIMAHGFSTNINMTADKYAEAFRKAGFVVILYDHRNLGDSEGMPRQEINYTVQARGYLDCLDFASTLPEVDVERIALWGCSSSGRLVHIIGSLDDRPKAIVAQVPAFGSALPAKDSDPQAHAHIKECILSDDISTLKQTNTGPLRVVSYDQQNAPSYLPHPTAADWFFKCGQQENSGWKNQVSIATVDDPFTFHSYYCSAEAKASVLMVVAKDDEIDGANPEVARAVFDKIDQPKEWVEINGGHFGLLYYPSALFDKVSQAEIDFLKRTL